MPDLWDIYFRCNTHKNVDVYVYTCTLGQCIDPNPTISITTTKERRSPLGMSWGFALGTSEGTQSFTQTPRTARECSVSPARQGHGKLTNAGAVAEWLTEFAAPLT